MPDSKSQMNYERTLKIVAVEGITKMFNAMASIQKESLDQVLKMSLDDKIGAGAAKKKFKKGFQKRGRGGAGDSRGRGGDSRGRSGDSRGRSGDSRGRGGKKFLGRKF